MPEPDFEIEEPTGGEPDAASGTGTVGFLADVVRKAVLTGMGALFLTEEGARKLAREWKLPKELAGFLVQQANGAKEEVLRVVGQEIRRFFESETFRVELMKLLADMSVEVKAEIRLKGSASDRKPRRTRRQRAASTSEADEAEKRPGVAEKDERR